MDRWNAFAEHDVERYAEQRGPDEDAHSGMSAYLHFGHASAHALFKDIADDQGWSVDGAGRATGKREGWWGMGPGPEAFLDELVTWRELGFNACVHMPGYDRYDSLPEWARRTLAEHAGDARPHEYSLAQLDGGHTHDPVWNATQWELRDSGRIHSYLRMLWGKKILEWSETPEVALETMIELNNRYALDGRDPNSYSGIFWVLGRYDRAWGPERPIFGKVRYMSSDSARRKLRMKRYLERWTAPASQTGSLPS